MNELTSNINRLYASELARPRNDHHSASKAVNSDVRIWMSVVYILHQTFGKIIYNWVGVLIQRNCHWRNWMTTNTHSGWKTPCEELLECITLIFYLHILPLAISLLELVFLSFSCAKKTTVISSSRWHFCENSFLSTVRN